MVKEVLNINSERKWFITFCIFYALISAFSIANIPLFDEDEGFFAEASRHMIETKDYIRISVNGEERYDKPALFFWINALSLKLFGLNEFAARLPSFCCFLASIILVYRFIKKYYKKTNAYNTTVLLFGIIQFQLLARAALSDNLLNLFIIGALFSFYDFYKDLHKKHLFYLYTFSGLGFLTKGPIAFVIIFGVIFLFLLSSKRLKFVFKLFHPGFILWAFLIPFPWFYLAYLKSGDFLFTDFFIKHNFGRFSKTMESHGGHLWYYIPVVLFSLVPFTHLIFSVIKNFKISEKSMFLGIWFLFPIILFSFSKTQLPHYISISYFPLIILIGALKSFNTKAITFQILFIFSVFMLLPILISKIEIKDFYVQRMLENSDSVFDLKYYLVFGVLIVSCFLINFSSFPNVYLLILIFSLGIVFFMSKYALLQQSFIKSTGLTLKSNSQTIYMKDHYNPSLSFYANRVIIIKNKLEKGDYYLCKEPRNFTDSLVQRKDGFIILKSL